MPRPLSRRCGDENHRRDSQGLWVRHRRVLGRLLGDRNHHRPPARGDRVWVGESMTVTVFTPTGEHELTNVTGLDATLPGALKITQRAAGETVTPTGLVAKLGGSAKITLYPWHKVQRVEVEE